MDPDPPAAIIDLHRGAVTLAAENYAQIPG